MAYTWDYEYYTDDMGKASGQDIPVEIERLVFHAVMELFHNLPAANNVDRTLSVHQAIHVISNTYKKKMDSDIRPNWADPAFRCAYVYLYFLKHSSLVCDVFYALLHPMVLNDWASYIRVCCIGGGPGSDVVGLMVYLRSMNMIPYIECDVMDLNPSWERAWETIQKFIPTEPKVKVTYTPFDMADEASWLWRDVEAAVSVADLVTFVKSISAIQTFIANHRIGTGAIPAVLKALKPGAIVLYIDNMRDDNNIIFLQMTSDAGLHLVQEWHHESYSKPSKESLKAMKQFKDLFKYSPLRGCKVSACLLRKPTCQPKHLQLHWTPSSEVTLGQPKNSDQDVDMRLMLCRSPFESQIFPDVYYRPTFSEHAALFAPQKMFGITPSKGAIHKKRRKRRRKRKRKKVLRRESVGDSVTSPLLRRDSCCSSTRAKQSWELDFATDILPPW